MAATTTTTSATTTTTEESSPRKYNPRWKGYCLVVLAGVIQFSAVANIQNSFNAEWGIALQFGISLSLAAALILLYPHLPEGYAVAGLTFYAVLNVAYVTRVGGIAYRALNVYGAAWLGLAACLYCLERWSADHDLLSWAELTGISATLKSWYTLLLASFVVTWSGVNFWIAERQAAVIAVSFGALTSAFAVFFICTHYNLISLFPEGGWAEIGAALGCCSMWILATALLTQEAGIGATIVGDRNDSWRDKFLAELGDGNCTITLQNTTYACETFLDDRLFNTGFPGSNLYISTWTCLLASFHLLARWKAQQAMQFANAESKRKKEELEDEGSDAEDDEFQDAEESEGI